jgi:hypothetical protein
MNSKKTRKDFVLLPDPIWDKDGVLKPFFLDWWQRVAEIRFGDKSKVWDAAKALGYIGSFCYNQETESIEEYPIRFDYDPALYRESLGIPADMPIIKLKQTGQEAYRHLLELLLDGNEGANDQ